MKKIGTVSLIMLINNKEIMEKAGLNYEDSFEYIYFFLTCAHNVVYK